MLDQAGHICFTLYCIIISKGLIYFITLIKWDSAIWIQHEEIRCADINEVYNKRVYWLLGPCEHSNEPLGSIKCGEFLDQPSDCYLLKKYFSPCS
jgi:hypothetical protein